MAERADGSVVIKADIEIDKPAVQKELNSVKREIEKLNKTQSQLESKKNPLVAQMKEYGASLDEARTKLEALKAEQARVGVPVSSGTRTPEQQVDAYNRQIEKLNKTKSQLESKRNPLADEMREYGASLDEARTKLEALKAEQSKVSSLVSLETGTPAQQIDAFNRQSDLTKELAQQQTIVDELQRKFDSVSGKVERYDNELKQTSESLNTAQARAAKLSKQLMLSKELAQQQTIVDELQRKFDSVGDKVNRYDDELEQTTKNLHKAQTRAGELSKELAEAGDNSEKMSAATKKASRHAETFAKRLASVVRSALVFTVISQALASFRTWLGKVIATNEEARKAIAKLQGALLTLAQPLVNVIIPAFTAFVTLLAQIVNVVADLISRIFGGSIETSREQAEALYEQSNALDEVGSSAKKAGKTMASFDEINKLASSESSFTAGGAGGSSNIQPDFSQEEERVEEPSWLEKILNKVNGWVKSALLLGGIALIVIGACTGNLLLVLAGALALGTVYVAVKESGELDDWVKVLQLEKVATYVTAAALLTGIALIALGAILGRLGLVIAGAGLLALGVAYGDETDTLKPWAEKLGLDSVFDYIVAAATLAGIALIVFGIIRGNVFLAVTGMLLIGIATAADSLGQETLENWWEVLKLTTIKQWVGVVMLLAGIALIAIGAAMGNIVMIIAGIALVGLGAIPSATDGNLKNWVTTLGLEKVVGWVTAGLLLGGMVLIVIGAVTANIKLVLAGIGLLGASVAVGVSSGTFATWLTAIIDGLKSLVTKLKNNVLNPIANAFSAFYNGVVTVIEALINGVISMLNGFISGINAAIKVINKIPGVEIKTITPLEKVSIPRLAEGAVIPPNREFMAVLGDQKHGTNIETPLATMVQAFKQAMAESGGVGGDIVIRFEGSLAQLAQVLQPAIEREGRRKGTNLGGVVG